MAGETLLEAIFLGVKHVQLFELMIIKTNLVVIYFSCLCVSMPNLYFRTEPPHKTGRMVVKKCYGFALI